MNFGALEGLRWAELPEEHQAALLNFEGFQAPQGESTEQFRERVYGFFEGSSPGRYLVFTHGGVLRLVLRDLGQEGFLPPCAAVGLDWSRRRVLLCASLKLRGEAWCTAVWCSSPGCSRGQEQFRPDPGLGFGAGPGQPHRDGTTAG